MSYPEQVMRETAQWATWFASDWKQDHPNKIHNSQIADDGSPQWHPDFVKWLAKSEHLRVQHNHKKRGMDQRLRTTKVMRLLRGVSIREYEVTYRVLILGERLEDTTKWLNERAHRNAIPFPPHRPEGPHYTKKDTTALFVCAIDYCRAMW